MSKPLIYDSTMIKLAMGVEYDGSAFHGWQTQDHATTIQEQLEQALSKVADHAVSVQCAGRTDAGVHATGQVIHYKSNAARSIRNWILGTNANLPSDININWCKEVTDNFHARYSAISRRYHYIILNRKIRSSIWRNRVVWKHKPLNALNMHVAAQSLVGTHDFSSFRALGCQAKNPVRTLLSLHVSNKLDKVIIDIEANAFLHHMVRNIAGVLIAIGAGEKEVTWCQEVLEYRDRTLGGVTAPPEGLYLTDVKYPVEFDLPSNPPFL